jgi:excisionase family DNA binding protein
MVISDTHTPELLNVKQAAHFLGLSVPTLYRKVAAGEVPALKLGSGPRAVIRIDARELEQWLYEARRAPAGEVASGAAGSPRSGPPQRGD